MSKHDRELEVKFYIQDRARMERRILALGAEVGHGRTFERNLRFDSADGGLTRQKQLLRLRQDHGVWLTFKGPSKLEDGIISRQEIEVELGDFETGQRLLEATGYKVVVIYEKYRTTYTLDGLEITLDELPIGAFIEIEGQDNELIKDWAERLQLDWETAIGSNYLGLFAVLSEEMDLPFRDLTFENFRDINITADQLGVSPADRG